MPTYRIRPGVVPKHLKVPKQPPPAPAGSPHSKIKPPIRKALPNQPSGASKVVPSGSSVDGGSAGTNSASGGFSLQLPRFRASRESWIGRNSAYRDVGKIHPYAKLKDPLSVRVYDWIVRLSVPGSHSLFRPVDVLGTDAVAGDIQVSLPTSCSGPRPEKSRI